MLEQAGLQPGYFLGDPMTPRPLAENDGGMDNSAETRLGRHARRAGTDGENPA